MKAVPLCVFLLSCPVYGHYRGNSGSIYYFNNPESVKTPGILGEATLPAGKLARLFFHFANKTGHVQPFTIVSSGDWNASRGGFGHSMDPGTAGSAAVKQFLGGHSAVPPVLQVLPGETVSGIIECAPAAPVQVSCALGVGETHWKVEVANNPVEVQDVDLAPGAVSLTFGEDGPGAVDGHYGTTVRLQFHNRTIHPMRATFSVSPRGGGLSFVYLLNNTVFCAPNLPARAHEKLFTMLVPAGDMVALDTIPTGGYSYPVKVIASVLQ